jgi:hypothetical protein
VRILNIKIPSKNLCKQLCAEGFNFGVNAYNINDNGEGDHYLGFACSTCVPFFSRLPEDGTPVPKQVGVDTINFISRFLFYCILLNELVG